MTLAASIDSNIIYLIAAAAYGVFAWWNDRRQKKILEEEERRQAQTPTQHERQGTQPSAAPTMTNSEAERTRRFLEALGVPTNQLPPPPRPAPAPKPQPKPASPTMAPRPIAMPIPRPMTRPEPAPVYTPPPRPVVRPVQPVPRFDEPLPAESRDAGHLEVPAFATSEVAADFARMHAEDKAAASLPIDATGLAPTTRVEPVHVSIQGLALRDLLRSPENLRTAIVMSEVLGRPRGE
jgi:hypothetical protein